MLKATVDMGRIGFLRKEGEWLLQKQVFSPILLSQPGILFLNNLPKKFRTHPCNIIAIIIIINSRVIIIEAM